MMRSKLVAGALSAVLAISLCPGLAVAATLSGGDAAGTLGTQVKKTVWVISKISCTTSSDTLKSSSTKTFSYNDKGLVSKATRLYKSVSSDSSGTSSSSYSSTTTQTLGYRGKNLRRIASLFSSPDSSTTSAKPTVYTMKCKKGKPISATHKYNNGNDSSKTVYKYTYADGNLESYTSTYYAYLNDDGSYANKMKKRSQNTYRFSNFNEDGHPAKIVSYYSSVDGTSSVSTPIKYKYDKLGNVKQTRFGQYSPTVYSYTYKNGRVAKRTYGTASLKYKYTWKAIAVPAGYVSVVEGQQWSLVNGNLNQAFGPVNMGL